MNMFKSYFNKYFLEPIKGSFSRFPEIFVELVILAGVLIYDNRINNFNEDYRRLITSITIGLVILIIYHISLILASERFNLKLLTRVLGGVGVVLFASLFALYYYSAWANFRNFFLGFNTTAVIVTGVSLFFATPYLVKRNNFTIYVPYILTRALTTIFYTGALILGTIGVISLFSFLFQLNINNELYGDINILFSTLVGGPLFLGNIPDIKKNLVLKDYGIVWKVLIVRIVIPLATIATLIIFAYATIGRLIGVYDGNIFLVSAFSSLSAILVSVVVSDPFEKEIGYVKLFRKYAPYPMLLLVANLGVEVLIEISRSGLNVDNFITGLFTDFFAGAFLFMLLKRYYRPIFIPLLLSATLLVGGFTPFVNIEAWSFRSTSNQLEEILTELNMLNNNQITPRSDLTNDQKQKISDLLFELDNYHGFAKIEYIPNDFNTSQTKLVFGFEYYFGGSSPIVFVSLGSSLNEGVDISGYDRAYEFYVYSKEPTSVGMYEARIENNNLLIKEGTTTVATLSLETKILDLYQKYGTSKFEIDPLELVFVFDNPKYKLVVRNIGANITQDNRVTLENINGYLLVNE